MDDRPYGGGPGMLMMGATLYVMLFEQLKSRSRRWSKGNLPFTRDEKLDQSGVQNLSIKSKLPLFADDTKVLMNA